MIALSIFKALGDFFTNVVFAPLHALRGVDGWWASNSLNVLFILVGFGLFFYWMVQAFKFKREGTEDLP